MLCVAKDNTLRQNAPERVGVSFAGGSFCASALPHHSVEESCHGSRSRHADGALGLNRRRNTVQMNTGTRCRHSNQFPRDKMIYECDIFKVVLGLYRTVRHVKHVSLPLSNGVFEPWQFVIWMKVLRKGILMLHGDPETHSQCGHALRRQVTWESFCYEVRRQTISIFHIVFNYSSAVVDNYASLSMPQPSHVA